MRVKCWSRHGPVLLQQTRLRQLLRCLVVTSRMGANVECCGVKPSRVVECDRSDCVRHSRSSILVDCMVHTPRVGKCRQEGWASSASGISPALPGAGNGQPPTAKRQSDTTRDSYDFLSLAKEGSMLWTWQSILYTKY